MVTHSQPKNNTGPLRPSLNCTLKLLAWVVLHVSHHHLTKKKSALAVEIAELEALEKRKQELLKKSAPLARTSTPPSSAAPPSIAPPPSDNEDEDEKDEKATNLSGVAVNFPILSIKSVCLQTELSGSGGIGLERTPHY